MIPATLKVYDQLANPNRHEDCGVWAAASGLHDISGGTLDFDPTKMAWVRQFRTAAGQRPKDIADGFHGMEVPEIEKAWEALTLIPSPKARGLYPGPFSVLLAALRAGKSAIVGIDYGTLNALYPGKSGQKHSVFNHYVYISHVHLDAKGREAVWVCDSLCDGRTRSWGTAATGVQEYRLAALGVLTQNWGAQDKVPLGAGKCKAVILQPPPVVTPTPPPTCEENLAAANAALTDAEAALAEALDRLAQIEAIAVAIPDADATGGQTT